MVKGKFETPKYCPVCGTDVPPRALACQECGADETSGWKAEANQFDSEETFDYEAFVGAEFGGKPSKKRSAEKFWWIVALIVLAGLLWSRFFV